MPYEVSQVMDMLTKLSEEQDLKLCVTESVRGAVITAATVLIGGLLGGPAGMAAGGVTGAVVSAATARKFKPLVTVLQELPAHKRRELSQMVNEIVSSLEPSDAVALFALVQGSAVVRLKILEAMKSYFSNSQSSVQ